MNPQDNPIQNQAYPGTVSPQPQFQAPPPDPKGNKLDFLKKLSYKQVFIGVAAVLLLIGLSIGVKIYFFSPKPVEQINLTYWGLWEDSNSVNSLILQYEASNPNVKIKYSKQAKEDYRERLVNSLTKGEGPDIFRFHNTWVPMLSSWLSPLPTSIMDFQSFQNIFYPVTLKDLQRGSDLVGLPLMYDGLGLYINESIFSSSGKNPPTTWDDLRKTAQELTVKDKEGRIQQSGVALGRADNIDGWEDILALMMLQNGVDLASPTGKNAEDALVFYTLFAKTDRDWDESMPSSTQAFSAGKVAMYFGPSWRALEIKQQNPDLSFRVVPVPQLPKNNPTDADIAWASYWAEGVSSKSKNSQEAWKFLKYLSEKNSLQILYSTVAKTRLFGPIYPRIDMKDLAESDPVVGAYIKQAPFAKSWYLASRTFDGATGINTSISNYFKDAVNGVVDGQKDAKDVLPIVAQGVTQILGRYSQEK